jgi:hypothetical protein
MISLVSRNPGADPDAARILRAQPAAAWISRA